MLREFDEFIVFCIEHGNTLKNHKAFMEMSQNLRNKIESVENTNTGAYWCNRCNNWTKDNDLGVCCLCNTVRKL